MLAWSDISFIQLCEKPPIPMLNIPSYSPDNTLLGVQANSLPANIIPSLYIPSSHSETNLDIDVQAEEQQNLNTESTNPYQSAAVAKYIQKLQATTLQQLIKEQMKKDKVDEKIEHAQNNILNIPSVPVFRNTQLQNGGNFINTDQLMISINPNDLNMHMETEENESNLPPVVKVEQQIQTDSPKREKKPKFRAKIGEIKVNVTMDGCTLYSCPECNSVFTEKVNIEQHIQAHIQERKYQCKECGAMLKRKEHLDQHMRGHSDERPFKCKLCERAFKRNEHLTRHFVIHSGDKKFPCSVCSKPFSRKDHLNKHMQTHLGIRKNKVKKDSYYIDQKDLFDKNIDISTINKQEISYILKDGCLLKQETTFLQHIQNLQKDPAAFPSLSSFKEQVMKDTGILQQQNVDTNEIFSNPRYLMPS